MVSRKDSNLQRKKRHARVRAKISGTASRPRLCVYRSLANIYAQVIDDTTGNTLVSASSVEKRAAEKGITDVVFDRGGYIYHGRVKELAEAAREAGLKF